MKVFSVVSAVLLAGFLFGQEFVPIHEIQSDRIPGTDTSSYFGQIVTTTGIVTSDVGAVAGSRNFFIEEAQGGPWSGIMCWFQNSGIVSNFKEGDSVIITGQVNEYYGNTEIIITDSASAVLVDSGHELPPFALIQVAHLDTTGASPFPFDSAEAYEGVLIEVDTVFVTNESGANNDWEITDGTGYCYVRRNGNYTYSPHEGDMLDYVRGIIRVYYGFYRISPRKEEDLKPNVLRVSSAYAIRDTAMEVVFTKEVDPSTAEVEGNYTLSGGLSVLSANVIPDNQKIVKLITTEQTPGELYTIYVSNVQDTFGGQVPENDSASFYGGIIPITTIQSDTVDSGLSAWQGKTVTLRGICIMDSSSSSWYYIEEPEGGPFSGVMIYDYEHEPLRGDDVVLVGTVYEYNYMTEIQYVSYFEILSSGNPEPEPMEIQTGDISAGAPDAEQYEGALVHTDTAAVVNSNPTGPYWEIDDGTGICRVGNRAAYEYEPSDGDTVLVTGVVRFVGGGYTIEPRGDDDIEIVYQGVSERPSSAKEPYFYKIDRSSRGVELILFLRENTPIEVTLYDVTGRKVRKFPSRLYQEGTHRLQILEKRTPSGIYFLKIESPTKSRTSKILWLK